MITYKQAFDSFNKLSPRNYETVGVWLDYLEENDFPESNIEYLRDIYSNYNESSDYNSLSQILYYLVSLKIQEAIEYRVLYGK